MLEFTGFLSKPFTPLSFAIYYFQFVYIKGDFASSVCVGRVNEFIVYQIFKIDFKATICWKVISDRMDSSGTENFRERFQ